MTRPTATQLAEAKAGGRVTVAGAHTVGGPDGGPGLPGTGWSVTHGDLRVPHFLGLHALQVLPLFAVWLSSRRFSDRARLQLVLVAGFSYGSLFAILLWQALRGDSLVRPEGPVVAALAAWLIATSIATLGTTWRKPVHVAP
jgi:hypothetical protein